MCTTTRICTCYLLTRHSRRCVFNVHNTHVWSDENPHAIHSARHRQQFFVNVWTGIVGDNLTGHFVESFKLYSVINND
jgi:hypothetical protein